MRVATLGPDRTPTCQEEHSHFAPLRAGCGIDTPARILLPHTTQALPGNQRDSTTAKACAATAEGSVDRWERSLAPALGLAAFHAWWERFNQDIERGNEAIA